MRLLKRLKDCGQKPVNKWDESIDFNNASAAADTSEWMPRQQARSLKPTKPASQARKGQFSYYVYFLFVFSSLLVHSAFALMLLFFRRQV